MSKQPPPAPTASAVGPCHTVIQIVGRPGTESLPSTIAPPDHPRVCVGGGGGRGSYGSAHLDTAYEKRGQSHLFFFDSKRYPSAAGLTEFSSRCLVKQRFEPATPVCSMSDHLLLWHNKFRSFVAPLVQSRHISIKII